MDHIRKVETRLVGWTWKTTSCRKLGSCTIMAEKIWGALTILEHVWQIGKMVV